jgi:hypothetical protein
MAKKKARGPARVASLIAGDIKDLEHRFKLLDFSYGLKPVYLTRCRFIFTVSCNKKKRHL